MAATEQYASYVRDGYSPAASVAWNEQEANQELIQGRAAMFVGWWWMASRMLDAELPEVADNAAFAPAPGWDWRGHCILRLLVAGGHLGAIRRSRSIA